MQPIDLDTHEVMLRVLPQPDSYRPPKGGGWKLMQVAGEGSGGGGEGYLWVVFARFKKPDHAESTLIERMRESGLGASYEGHLFELRLGGDAICTKCGLTTSQIEGVAACPVSSHHRRDVHYFGSGESCAKCGAAKGTSEPCPGVTL